MMYVRIVVIACCLMLWGMVGLASATLQGSNAGHVWDSAVGNCSGASPMWLAKAKGTSKAQQERYAQRRVADIRKAGRDLRTLAKKPAPRNLTRDQKNSFTKYSQWLKTQSGDLYAFADKWESQIQSVTTSQTYDTSLLDALTSTNETMFTDLLSLQQQMAVSSDTMASQSSILQAQHDAAMAIIRNLR